MPHRLDAGQIQTYRDQGFLLIDEPLYSAAKFAAFKERFEWHLKLWEGLEGHPVEGIDRANFVDPEPPAANLDEAVKSVELVDAIRAGFRDV